MKSWMPQEVRKIKAFFLEASRKWDKRNKEFVASLVSAYPDSSINA